MNRKMIAILLSTCTCLAFPAASMAVETDTASSQSISVTLTAEPEYTITIPESVSMGNDGTTVNVTASDVKNLPEGKKISVTIAGTSAYRNQMVLEADTSPRTSIRYQIINEAGDTIQTNAATGETAVGKEVVSFTEDGSKQYQIIPVIAGSYKYDVAYTGSITFGIALQ